MELGREATIHQVFFHEGTQFVAARIFCYILFTVKLEPSSGRPSSSSSIRFVALTWHNLTKRTGFLAKKSRLAVTTTSRCLKARPPNQEQAGPGRVSKAWCRVDADRLPLLISCYTILCMYCTSNRQNYCSTNLVLLRRGLSEVARNLHNG